jgi:hypothetical protein
MKIKTIISAILTLLTFGLIIYISNTFIPQLPSSTEMIYNLKSNVSPLTISDIVQISDKTNMSNVTFTAELPETTVKEESVTPTLINEFYFDVYGIDLASGKFTEKMITSKKKVAVISEGLSIKLFFNSNSVGKSIIINNEKYTVCGIYKESDTLINKLSSDGKERVFIPYTSVDDYKKCDIEKIAYLNSSYSAPLIEQMNLSQYYSINYSEKSKALTSFLHISFFILFVAFAFFLLKFWYFLLKKYYLEIKDNLQSNYFFKSIKSIPIKYILLVIFFIGIPCLLLYIFIISDFSIYILPEYLPYDNIFDISYYIQKAVEISNQKNSVAFVTFPNLVNIYSTSFKILLILCIQLVEFVIILSCKINKIFKTKFTLQ